jgi:hypothetical protein
MELKEFISGTLIEIVEAVHVANENLKDKNAVISPSIRHGDGTPNDFGASPYVERVEFDVAVTASDQKTAGIGVGIRVLGAKLGGDGKTVEESQSVSRIKFSIPLMLPQNKFFKPKNWRDKGKSRRGIEL